MRFIMTKDIELFVTEGYDEENDVAIGYDVEFFEEEEYDVDMCNETDVHYHVQFGDGSVTDMPKECIDVIER